MADITVTAANVQPGTGAEIDTRYRFGATVTAGQAVYLDTATNTWKLADADASAATAVLGGVALNGGASGQPAAVLKGGNYNPGGTVVAGTIYCLSANAGGICPAADLGSGDTVAILGVATSASNIAVQIHNSGGALA